MKLYFMIKSNPNISAVNFKDFEDNCSNKAMLLDIQTPSEGIVNNSFVDYSIEENSKCIYRFFEKEPYKVPKEQLKI